MVDVFQKDRLWPSLLQRLSDEEPQKKSESLDQRTVSLEDYKKSVLQDLKWLLNTGNLESIRALDGYDEVKKSVLNLGVPDFTGKAASSLSTATLERVMRQTILDFEPRILPKSLKVRVVDRGEDNDIVFHVEGELWWQPMPEHLYLTTTLDLELGKIEVKLTG